MESNTAASHEDVIELSDSDEEAEPGAGPSGGAAGGLVDNPIVIDGASDDETDGDWEAARRSAARDGWAGEGADPPQPPSDEPDMLAAQRSGLAAFLGRRAEGLEVLRTWHNPAALPGGALYRRFVAEWARVPSKRTRLCFHGTAEANVDAICANGLDPARRLGQAYGPGEYFAGHAATSLGYCRGGGKMIVFALLTDASAMTHHSDQVVVNHRQDAQLPLAVVTFDARKAFAGLFNPGAAILPPGMLPPPPHAPPRPPKRLNADGTEETTHDKLMRLARED